MIGDVNFPSWLISTNYSHFPKFNADCNRLRRSVRGQKCPNTVCESDEQETLPMGSTAKSLQETYKVNHPA